MKVLFITRKYPPIKGGMESYSYNLISNYQGDYKALTLGKKQIHLLWFLPYCLFYVLFHISKFDVLELGDMLLCGIGWFAKKIRPSIKVVATVHGLDITYKNPIYQTYLKMFSKGFDMYVPNSTYTREVAENRGYSPCQTVFPATLGSDFFKEKKVSDNATFRRKYNIADKTVIITTVGRLVERKGVKWFIENVMNRIPELDICYLIVGKGEMKEQIEQAITSTGEQRVHLLGAVSDAEIDDIYANTDIFLMPNIYVEGDVEGYGMVAVEAAASGCLVVAARIQGIMDAVLDGVNGILYEAENVDVLADLLTDVVTNYETHMDKLRDSALEYVKRECTGEAIARKYEDLFQTLS